MEAAPARPKTAPGPPCLPARPRAGRRDLRLLEACAAGDEEGALALLAQGARPVASGSLGSTCLMFAARRDQERLFLALCAHPECDPLARDLRGRDALAWASARRGLLGGRSPSTLFEALDDQLFDLASLDAQGRHACQAALDCEDERACLFWLSRAPPAQVEKAFAAMGSFAKLNGAHERARRWQERSEAAALSRSLGVPSGKEPPRGPPSRL